MDDPGEILAAAAAEARPDSAFVGDDDDERRRKPLLSSPASSPTTTPTTTLTPTTTPPPPPPPRPPSTNSSNLPYLPFHLLAASFALGCLFSSFFVLSLLPRVAWELTPPLTPDSLPPRWFHSRAISLLSSADALSRALTPPNLALVREVSAFWHAAQVRTAAELRVAELLDEEEERARRECLFSSPSPSPSFKGDFSSPPPPNLRRRLSCSLRLLASPPSLTARQIALRSVPSCKWADEKAEAARAAAFAIDGDDGSGGGGGGSGGRGGGREDDPRLYPLAGCEAVAFRIERLLRALSAYGVFEEATPSLPSWRRRRTRSGEMKNGDGDDGDDGDDGFLSTRWRNSRRSSFLSSRSPHSVRSFILLITREGQWQAMGRMPIAIATGKPAFIDPERLGSKGDAAVEALLSPSPSPSPSAESSSNSNSSSSSSSLPGSSKTQPPQEKQKKYASPDDYWAYLEKSPEERAAVFDAAMVEGNRAAAAARAVAEDAPPFASVSAAAAAARRRKKKEKRGKEEDEDAFAVADVVDVGGGAGELAAEVLRRHAWGVGRAVVVDLPRVAERSRRAWACAAAAAASAGSNSSSSSSPPSSSSCPSSLAALAPHARTYPPSLRGRVFFEGGDMFRRRSLSAAVERALSFEDPAAAAAAALAAEEQEAAATRGRGPRRARGKRTKKEENNDDGGAKRRRRRLRRLFLLRDVIHDWGDEETVRILSSIRAAMGRADDKDDDDDENNEYFPFSSSSSSLPQSHHHRKSKDGDGDDRDDRVLIVGRVPSERPLCSASSFVRSLGAQDADLLMLSIFGGGGAGERTAARARVLLDRAGLELVAVHGTRSWFSVIEARVKKNDLIL